MFVFRYSQLNSSASSLIKKYDTRIPRSLHDRPKEMVEHCVKKLKLAELSAPSDVVSLGNSIYSVKGEVQPQYLVDLSAPSCECHDWSASIYPCKHFFMVFIHTNQDFSVLPEHYRCNPWMTLDKEVMVKELLESGSSCADAECSNAISSSSVDSIHMEEVVEDKDLNLKCREVLKELTNFTYINTSDEVAKDMLLSLNTIKSTVRSLLPKKSGLIISPQPARKKPIKRQPHSDVLPRKYKRRRQNHNVEFSHDKTPVLIGIDEQACSILVTENAVEQDITSIHAQPDLYMETNSLPVPIAILEEGYLLTDIEINAVLKIFNKQWPDVKTHDCLMSQRRLGFDRARVDDFSRYCQIINDPVACHWIAVTNIPVPNQQVKVFDSLGMQLGTHMLKAIAS